MAWNDPDWGKKNNGGPPDLDELWRKFNQKLNAMFGGKGKEPSSGGGMPSSGQAFGGLGIVAALAIVVWLGSGFYIVNAGERGVVLRFGKYVETTEPGPRWHMPYPIESAEVVNMEQVRTVEVGYRNTVKSKVLKESLMLTDDENIIDIQFAVQYTLKDPKAFLFNNRHPDDAVLQAAETAIREIVGKSKMDFVLYEGRAEVAAKASKLMQEILDRYKTGISHQQGDDAECTAAGAGAGRVRRCGQGRAGQGAPEKRRPGLRQRCGAQGARRCFAPAAGSRRLQAARDRQCRG